MADVIALGLVATAPAASAAAPTQDGCRFDTMATPRPGAAGHLDASIRPDLTRILPGPPAPGSPAALADARDYAATRRLAGTARWCQAQVDVSDDLPVRFRDAIGFAIDLDRTPVFARLLARFGTDRSAAKRHWQ